MGYVIKIYLCNVFGEGLGQRSLPEASALGSGRWALSPAREVLASILDPKVASLPLIDLHIETN